MGERQACAPGPPWAPYNGVLRPHVSQSSFFGKVPRVKYAGFTRQVPHPLQAGIMSSNALTILPFAYWAPRTKVDLPRDGAQCRGCFQFGRRFHGSVSSAASVKTERDFTFMPRRAVPASPGGECCRLGSGKAILARARTMPMVRTFGTCGCAGPS
jgi:hypothetical protein